MQASSPRLSILQGTLVTKSDSLTYVLQSCSLLNQKQDPSSRVHLDKPIFGAILSPADPGVDGALQWHPDRVRILRPGLEYVGHMVWVAVRRLAPTKVWLNSRLARPLLVGVIGHKDIPVYGLQDATHALSLLQAVFLGPLTHGLNPKTGFPFPSLLNHSSPREESTA